MHRPILLVGLLWAGAAAADDGSALEACLADRADNRESCIHAIFDACIAAAPVPTDTVMGWKETDRTCGARELAAWDAMLNREYRALREVIGRFDAAAPDALRDAQRAWIAWRDTNCAWPAVMLRGNDAHHHEVNCPLRATALRALELRNWREMMQ